MGESDAARRPSQSGRYWSSRRGFPRRRQQMAFLIPASRMSRSPLLRSCRWWEACSRGCSVQPPSRLRRNLQPLLPRPPVLFPRRRFPQRRLPRRRVLRLQLPLRPRLFPSRHPPAAPPPRAVPPPLGPSQALRVRRRGLPPGQRRLRGPAPACPQVPGSPPAASPPTGTHPASKALPGRSPMPPANRRPARPPLRTDQRPAAAACRPRELRRPAGSRWVLHRSRRWRQPKCGWGWACWVQREPRDSSSPGSAGSSQPRPLSGRGRTRICEIRHFYVL